MLIPDEFEVSDIVYILMMQIYETFFKAQNKKTIIFKIVLPRTFQQSLYTPIQVFRPYRLLEYIPLLLEY